MKMFKRKEICKKQFEEEKINYANKVIENCYVFPIREFNKHMKTEADLYWSSVYEARKQTEPYKIMSITDPGKKDVRKIPYVYNAFWDKNKRLSFTMFTHYDNDIEVYVVGGPLNNPAGDCISAQPRLEAQINDSDNKIVIQNICCQEEDRGKGYGTAMLNALIDFAKRLHIDYLEGELVAADEVDSENYKRRNALYKKMGFAFNEKYVIKDISFKNA